MGRTAMVLAATGLQVLTALPAAPAETWSWFRSVSTQTDWWITQGKGDVNVSSNRFEATLRDAGNPQEVRLALQGSVSRGLIKARVTVLSSDAPVFEVSGRLKRFCWAEGGGREILVLTNGHDVVGLRRELSPAKPCKPAA